jgi:hypothetical protein
MGSKFIATIIVLIVNAVTFLPLMAGVNWLFGDGFTLNQFNIAFAAGFTTSDLVDVWLER